MSRPFSDAAPTDILDEGTAITDAGVTTSGVSVAGYDWLELWLRIDLLTGGTLPTKVLARFETSLDGENWADVTAEDLVEGVYVLSAYQVSWAVANPASFADPLVRMARIPVHGRQMRAVLQTDEGIAGGGKSRIQALRRVGA